LKILALDTSGSNCSVCIIDDNSVIAEFNVNSGTTHSQNLMPMINDMIKYAIISLEDIDVFACSIGPGSFTGLRIGIATIKGMALSLNKPAIGVPSLVGLAYNIPYFKGLICPIIDAKNNNVYSGVFEYANNPILMGSYISADLDTLINVLKQKENDILFVGDGAVSYKDKLVEEFGERALFTPIHLNNQLSISIAKAALDKAKLGEYDDYNTLSPLYLKKSQAERMLDLNATDINL
jgi:tRNA threonylcarbamoyladenosine biosynthesis protein TsaB